MHKQVSSVRPWKSIFVKHGDFQQRLYYLPGSSDMYPKYIGNGISNGIKKAGVAKKVSKQPAKKKVKSFNRR